ncbi:hypothetical protein Tco_1051303 [Tanacetum coccineum]
MKHWEELIRVNVFGLGGNQDHLLACLAHMMYCIVAEKQYIIAYFIAKRIEFVRATPKVNLPYGMLLTRLFRQVMEWYPHLDNGQYDIVNRVMRPLALVQERRVRKDADVKKGSHSTSSFSAFHHESSSYKFDDDKEIQDEGTSRNSTSSPRTYFNSLSPIVLKSSKTRNLMNKTCPLYFLDKHPSLTVKKECMWSNGVH